MALKSIHASSMMGRCIPAFLNSAKAVLPNLPSDTQSHFAELITDGQDAAQHAIHSGLEKIDSNRSNGDISVFKKTCLVEEFWFLSRCPEHFYGPSI